MVAFKNRSSSMMRETMFRQFFRRRSKESFRIILNIGLRSTIHLSGPHNKYPTLIPCMYIYPHKRNVDALLKVGVIIIKVADSVSNALLCGCKNCAGYYWLLLLQVNPFSTSTWTRMDACWARKARRSAQKNVLRSILNGTLQLFFGSWCMERSIK